MEFIEDLKSRVDIVEVCSRYMEVKRAGRLWKACCPFHSEKSASFTINPERGFAYCFGCHAHGDVIGLTEKLEGVSFQEAVKLLAERAGMEIPANFGGGSGNREKKDRLLDLQEDAASFFEKELEKHTPAREYLIKRGVDTATIASFRIGYAPSGNELSRHLESKGYTRREIADGGLAVVRDMGGNELRDKFYGRVMFPICDRDGRVIAFTGRVLGEGEPKYLNSPETPLFTKGSVLFALDKARDAIREKGYALVVEGQMDAIACHQAGIRETVAASGTAFTEMHAKMLEKLCKELRVCTDADKAGVGSAKRIALIAATEDLSVRFVKLPAGAKDPDEALKMRAGAKPEGDTPPTPPYVGGEEGSEFREAVATPLSLLEFYREFVLPGLTIKEQAHEVLEVAAHFASAVEREVFIRDAAVTLRLKEETLYEELRRVRMPARKEAAEAVVRQTVYTREDLLVGLLLAYDDVREAVANDLPPEVLRRLAEPTGDEAATTQREALILYTVSQTELYTAEKRMETAKELLKRIATKDKEGRKQELLGQIAEAERKGDTNEAMRLLQVYQEMGK